MSRTLEPGIAPLAATVPLVEELTPAPDPWEAAQRLAGRPHLLFLDSAAPDSPWSRFSFVSADPFDWINTRGSDENPFPRLADRLARWRMEAVPGLPPFQGGAAGLFGYDLCHHIERLPWPAHDEFALPDLAVGLYDWVLAFDHRASRSWLISTGLPERDPLRRRRRAALRLQAAHRWLRSDSVASAFPPGLPLPAARLCPQHPSPLLPNLTSTFDHDGYLAAVRQAIEYVHAGDCFQVNVAQRLLHPATLAPLDLYRRLRERNAAPFAGLLDLGDAVVASASPERFLRVEDGAVETRPIKGTRPRGRTLDQDRAAPPSCSAAPRTGPRTS